MLQFLHIIFIIVLIAFDVFCMQYSCSHGWLSTNGFSKETAATYGMYMVIATVLMIAYAIFFYYTYKQIKFIRCIIYPLSIFPVISYIITISMSGFAGMFAIIALAAACFRYLPRWLFTLFLYGYNLDKEDKYNKYR